MDLHLNISDKLLNPREVKSLLQQGVRITLFIRHAERPPLSSDDPTFGVNLPITPAGIAAAITTGNALQGITDVHFAASPMLRCQLTACHLAQGMGIADPKIYDEPNLGVEGFYYKNVVSVQTVMRNQGYMNYMLRYLEQGRAEHSQPLDTATKQMLAWLKKESCRQLNIFVSHDIFIAAFLTGLQVAHFTAENWVGYMDGAVLANHGNNHWVCHRFDPGA